MRNLVDELRKRNMSQLDISLFLQFSPSGTRKYVHDLKEYDLIQVVGYEDGTAVYLGRPVYGLCANIEARLKAFFETMERNSVTTRRPSREVAVKAVPANSGRHLHVMVDDCKYNIRMDRTPIMRDPLVAALFGPARKAN